MRSEVLAEVDRLEPSDLVERLPQLAGLVDVDLAGLLGVSLAELLADLERLDASLEHAALTAEVLCAGEAQR